jgi:hypothetical protein
MKNTQHFYTSRDDAGKQKMPRSFDSLSCCDPVAAVDEMKGVKLVSEFRVVLCAGPKRVIAHIDLLMIG